MSFEETELRLGLPGNNIIESPGDHHQLVMKKRGLHEISETDDQTETKLPKMADLDDLDHLKLTISANSKPPPPKGQVVGWPPIRSHRKNRLGVMIQNQKGSKSEDDDKISDHIHENKNNIGNGFVKVSLDGAPYLRKLDLGIYNSYKHLSHALAKLFASTIGNCGSQAAGMKNFMNESKLIDLLNGSDYVPTYQDKDGDWMLVGDVPWQMFVESCMRLRIMKGNEAIGLTPRAVEKCRNSRANLIPL